jgi:hypothetical protein
VSMARQHIHCPLRRVWRGRVAMAQPVGIHREGRAQPPQEMGRRAPGAITLEVCDLLLGEARALGQGGRRQPAHQAWRAPRSTPTSAPSRPR